MDGSDLAGSQEKNTDLPEMAIELGVEEDELGWAMGGELPTVIKMMQEAVRRGGRTQSAEVLAMDDSELAADIANARTIGAITELYYDTVHGSDLELKAAEKWISLCQTMVDLHVVHENTEPWSRSRRKVVNAMILRHTREKLALAVKKVI